MLSKRDKEVFLLYVKIKGKKENFTPLLLDFIHNDAVKKNPVSLIWPRLDILEAKLKARLMGVDACLFCGRPHKTENCHVKDRVTDLKKIYREYKERLAKEKEKAEENKKRWRKILINTEKNKDSIR